ncbi:MAG: response regulator [Leptolyngbya sp. LCM1.Bin17]|nr:MAG: response regulator [Leptolyngbya sp. LCM1.Bin17]
MTKRILVIDDELDIREIVCLSIEAFSGWDTEGAASGWQGLDKARQGDWDAILLDISMPDMDGVEVFEKLQQNSQTQSIPVILLTAKVLPRDRDRFAKLGVAGVITKPFDPINIGRQMANLLSWPTL